jgi:hypothetical protein
MEFSCVSTSTDLGINEHETIQGEILSKVNKDEAVIAVLHFTV